LGRNLQELKEEVIDDLGWYIADKGNNTKESPRIQPYLAS
jgi:hypothetical protein